MTIKILRMRYVFVLNLIFTFNIIYSQSNSKDTLCAYVDNVSRSNVNYITDQRKIPKKINRAIRKLEKNKIKIVSNNKANFSDIKVNNNKYGMVYFSQLDKYYYLMLKQNGFVPHYILKILIEKDSEIIAIKNFYMTSPYRLDEFAHLKWGCSSYITK